MLAMLSIALIPALVVTTTATRAEADPLEPAPGNPGVPQDPSSLLSEDFEATGQTGAESILDYVGADGTTYTADYPWTDMVDCNGTILQYTTDTGPCPNDEFVGFARNNIRRLADVLGQVGAGIQGGTDDNPTNGSTADTQANRALAEFTQQINPAPNSVVLRSNAPSDPVRQFDGYRFLSFSVDVAELSCEYLGGANNSRLNFYLYWDGVEYPTQSSPITACNDPATTSYDSPDLPGGWGSGGDFVRAGTYFSDGSQLVPPDADLELVLRNATGSADGNDFAIDNIRMLDVTPQLDKEFSPTSVPTGGTSTMTFTVTNTSELSAKEGWSFTDTLPDGLVVADPSNVGGTCDATTTAVAGSGTITVTDGALSEGEVSCTITVDVTSDTPVGSDPSPKAYENCAENVTERIGLLEPGCATVEFFSEPALTIEKSAVPAQAAAGDTVEYTITATNTGNGDYTADDPAVVTDDLSGVLDDASYNGDASSDLEPQPGYLEPLLSWSGPLPVGETVTITYSVTVDDPLSADGDNLMHNQVTAPDSNCEDGSTDAACSADVPIESLSIAKEADVGSAEPGETVNYTLTVTNDGQAPLTGVEVTDDLTGVLDDAAYNGDASATAGSVSYAEPVLTWTGDLAVGEAVTITYSVTVDDPVEGDHLLENAVAGPDISNCVDGGTDPDCQTVVPVTDLNIVKEADTDTAAPGDTVEYTITVTNTGEADYLGAEVTDDLTGVLDDASYNGDASATSGSVSYTEPVLTWTGDVPVGGSVTITYTVTLDDPATGDGLLANTVTGPSCPEGTDDPECSAEVHVLSLEIAKQVDVQAADPGDVVEYTITVTNTGEADYVGVEVTDDLTGVLDDATYNDDASATAGAVSYSDPTLTWTGDLAVGAAVTITYSVTVDDPVEGDHILANTVTGPSGSNCAADSTDPVCETETPVREIDVVKTANVSEAAPGDTVEYTITVTNVGQAAYFGAEVTDDLTDVLDDASYNGDASATAGAVSYTEPVLTWSGTVGVGETVTITYSVTVDDPVGGDHVLSNAVVGPSCPEGTDDPDCSSDIPIRSMQIVKEADVDSARPGEVVNYTITVTNTGELDYTGIEVSDDLSGVLDDAVYNDDASATAGAVSYTEPTLTWTGDLAVDGTVTITYSVTVSDPDEGDHSLGNVVTGPDSSNCPEDAEQCESVVPVGDLEVLKEADVETAAPGGTVTFTITIENIGQVDSTALYTDDLSGVLDDATYNDDAAADGGLVAYAEPNLSWFGTIPAGETVTITYSVTVDDPVEGDHVLNNVITGPDCPEGTSDPGCSAEVPIESMEIVKSADPAQAEPGGTIEYTITVTNTGEVDYTGVQVTDDLTEVLDDAAFNDDASADGGSVSYTEPVLTWTGDVPVGETVTITYSVTVDDPVEGDNLLGNAVTGPDSSNCEDGSEDPDCSNEVPVQSIEVVKSADPAQAEPGGTIEYSITVTNTGQVDYTGVEYSDDLTGILDDASYNDDASADSGSVSYSEPVLTWTGDVPVGGTVTITYSVTVDDPVEGDHILDNAVTGPGCPEILANPDCSAEVPIESMEIVKSANAVATQPGDTVEYTITVTNTGQVDYTGAEVTDDLTGVLDDASYNDDASATTGAVSYTEPILTWTGDLAVGETVTITYTVTVDQPDVGEHFLHNTVSGPSSSNCPEDAANCEVLVPVSDLAVVKSADTDVAGPGDTVAYTITVENIGQTELPGLEYSDDLTGVLDDADYNGDASADGGSVSYTEPILTWTGDLAVGETVTITYTVTVDDPVTGDHILDNSVTGPGCPEDPVNQNCTTQVPVQSMEIVKSADPAQAEPGGTVEYTITITNTGQVDYTGTEVTDDLTGVLDDAAYNDDAEANFGSVSYAEPILTWTGDVPVGGTVTITYSVTVDDPVEGDHRLQNSVTGPGCPVDMTEQADLNCSTDVPIDSMEIVKTADTDEAEPGDTVTYTITVTNTGQADFTAVEVADDLTDVLDDASYNDDASADSGSVAYSEPVLTWTGDLPVGASATITYSVTVNDPVSGDEVLGNVVTGPPSSNCPDDAERCSTRVIVKVPETPPTPPAPMPPPAEEIVQTGRSLVLPGLAALLLLSLGGIAIAVSTRRSKI